MTLLLALVALALAEVVTRAPPGLDAAYAPRRVAVLIGVQEYDDPALKGLRYAAKDARDLGSVLQNPALGGFDRVWVISGRDATTEEAIYATLAAATADLQRDDTFLLYASGHGTLALDPLEGSRLYLLPSDGILEEPEETGIPVADLEEMVNALPARRRVLILDTCHNGRARSAYNTATASLIQGMRGEAPAPRGGLAISESEARLYAAEYHQPAMEDPALQNGVYTHFLVDALSTRRVEADLDGDGLVDVVEAHDYAMDRTFRHTGGVQVPRAEYRITGREKIWLSGDPGARSSAEQALLSAYAQVLRQTRLLVDGVPRGEALGATAVAPGRHAIELQTPDGRVLLRRTLHLEAGTTTALEDLLAQHEPRLTVFAGSSIRLGPGESQYHPVSPELEVTRLYRAPAGWLRPDLHARASGMTGPVEAQRGLSITAGEVAAGGALGVGGGAVTVGPLLEVSVPWRLNSSGEEFSRGFQGSLTGAAGARALAIVPLKATHLSLRYDARISPYRYGGEWTHLWYHSVAAGVVFP